METTTNQPDQVQTWIVILGYRGETYSSVATGNQQSAQDETISNVKHYLELSDLTPDFITLLPAKGCVIQAGLIYTK